MPDDHPREKDRSPRRFPWRLELEFAKLLNTLGFSAYGSALWDLAIDAEAKSKAAAPLLPPEIWQQIKAQARHDPSVIAAGEAAIPFLKQRLRAAGSLSGVNTRALLGGGDYRPEILFVIPRLDAVEAKAVADAADRLHLIGARSFLILVTDQRGDASAGLTAVSGAQVRFWLDHCSGEGGTDARLLALFIHGIGASTVVVVGSRIGLETIGRYGRALKRFHHLFCILDAPAELDAHLFREVHHLRAATPHAKILAAGEAQARLLQKYSAGLGGPGITALPKPGACSRDAVSAIFGDALDDRRSDISQAVIRTIRTSRRSSASDLGAPLVRAPTKGQQFDVTVTIVFHREKALAVPALASLAEMIAMAKQAGLSVEARAMLDNSDNATRQLIEINGGFLDEVQDVSFGDPSLVRNAGTAKARGAYLTFLDGDDLWGSEWLSRAYRAATVDEASKAAVWHPTHLYSFFASDCDRHSATDGSLSTAWSQHLLHQSSADAGFEPSDLLFANLWSANAFAAKEIFERFPYRPSNNRNQTGIDDWQWNLETLGSGMQHLLVPDTVHLIRQKESGSLGQTHGLQDLLPILD